MIHELENLKWKAFDAGDYRQAAFFESVISTIEEMHLDRTTFHEADPNRESYDAPDHPDQIQHFSYYGWRR